MEKDWSKKVQDFVKSDQFYPVVILVVLIAALSFGYWNTLLHAVKAWKNPRYSHGYLIPFFSLFLLWIRREPFGTVSMTTRWAGVGIVCFGLVARLSASYLAINYIEVFSYLISLTNPRSRSS